MGRSYALGLAIGSLWLIAAGVGYSAAVLALIDTPAATIALTALLAAAVAAVAAAVLVIKAAARLPKDKVSAEAAPSMRRWFIIVFVVEVALILVVAAVCGATRRVEYIVPLVLVVVGVHFLPLARLFGVPRYYALGAGFCVIAIATMLLVEPTARIGAVLSWTVLPTFGCSLLAAAVGSLGLRESWGLTRSAR
jgi:hypothetical protein